MKVKVIKKAELESQAEQHESHREEPKPRRVARAVEKVEKWVAEIRERSEAETQIALEHLLHPDSKPST